MKLKPWQMWALIAFLIYMIAYHGHDVGAFFRQLENGLNSLSNGLNGG